jgi:Fic family protein
MLTYNIKHPKHGKESGMFEKKFNLTREENIYLAKRMVVDSIWKQANLEGIAITFPETSEIYEGRTIAGLTLQETKAINNLKHAWEFILNDLDIDIDIGFIRHINGIIGNEDVFNYAGEIRNFGVLITGTEWKPEIPTIEKIINTLSEIMAITNPIERALSLFGTICRGQWFADGNKRTAQLVANYSLIKDSCGILSIPVKDLPEAKELMIEFYETANFEKFAAFLYTKAINGIDFSNRTKNEEGTNTVEPLVTRAKKQNK